MSQKKTVLLVVLTILGSFLGLIIAVVGTGVLVRVGLNNHLSAWGATLGIVLDLLALEYAVAAHLRRLRNPETLGFGATAAVLASLGALAGALGTFQKRSLVRAATEGGAVEVVQRDYIVYVSDAMSRRSAGLSLLFALLPLALAVLALGLAWRSRSKKGDRAGVALGVMIGAFVLGSIGLGLCAFALRAPVQNESEVVEAYTYYVKRGLGYRYTDRLYNPIACNMLGGMAEDLGESGLTKYYPEWKPEGIRCVEGAVKDAQKPEKPGCGQGYQYYEGSYKLAKILGRAGEYERACGGL